MEKEVLSLRAQAKTAEHSRPHVPKNPWCPICQRANARRNQRRERRAEVVRRRQVWTRLPSIMSSPLRTGMGSGRD
eukprot:7863040-Alexandrium_andersonii.AAC.1